MMHTRSQFLSIICFATSLSCAWPTFTLVAQERGGLTQAPSVDGGLASLLPASTVAYAEFSSADVLLDHPLRTTIQQSPEFLKIWRSPDVLKARGGITLAETALGDSLENIVRKLTHGGLALGVDSQHNGIVVIARAESAEWLQDYLERLVELAKKNDGQAVETGEYRGVTAYKTKQAVVATVDEYLFVSDKKELGKLIVDRYLDKATRGLSENANFAKAMAAQPTSDATTFAWGYADVQKLREAGLAKHALNGPSDNFGAELILGGVLETLRDTPVITAAWTVEDHATQLTFSAPHTEPIDDRREYFFGPDGQGHALPLLQSDSTLASLSAYRDVSQLWLRAGDLFNEKVNDELAQADNTLTTLFSGRDFGEEILGALQPEMRLVVERTTFAEGAPIPAIRLPGFALVTQLREPEVMRGELKRIFQSLIGFLNVAGAQNGQPQLDMNMETTDSGQFITAQYVPEVDRKHNADAPIQFNFSPSLAFVNDHAILSSTIPLSKQLALQLAQPATTTTRGATTANTLLEIDIHGIQAALQDNRGQLIAQNMLEKGHSRQEAEAEIDTLLAILPLFERLAMQLGFDEQAELTIKLQIAK
ncbi:MAG: hypothetical protein R3C53_20710 [Pirellulaceae bacterium]